MGSQYWTAENLRTTKYNDDTAIPLVIDSFGVGGWTTLSTPAYCWPYNDSDSLGLIYGALYNYYVASDTNSRNVCPVEWHVPSDEEWTVLSDFLTNNEFGYEGGGGIGKAMASKNFLPSSGTDGTVGNDRNSNNASGFGGRPGGNRSGVDGQFYSGYGGGFWWTTSASSDTHSYLRNLMYSGPDPNRNFRNQKNGFSVRCVKD